MLRIIALEGMRFHTFIGNHPEEKLLVNEIEISLHLSLDDKSAGESDDIKNTIDYEQVYSLVQKIVSEKVSLLETLAQKIIAKLSESYSNLVSMRIRVSKLHPPLPGIVDRVSIEVNWVRNPK